MSTGTVIVRLLILVLERIGAKLDNTTHLTLRGDKASKILNDFELSFIENEQVM